MVQKCARTGTQGLLLHHDNVSAHTAAATLDFLAESSVQLVTHPPYSPDLAPFDWFFGQATARRKAFYCAEDARTFFEGIILYIPESTWWGAKENA